MADPSVSVPMTLSDLERLDAGVKFFRRLSVITLVPSGPKRTNSARLRVLVSHAPKPKEWGLSDPSFEGSPICLHPLTQNEQIRVVTHI